MSGQAPTKLVVASAGTYHLPFNRLSQWMERWLATRADVRLVMQHGPSSEVRGAENVALLPYTQLLDHCRAADAVVLQGGAGGVMDMRALGVVPLVVPRVPGGDGEVVDDHQLVFTSEMERLGVIRRALTYEELALALDTALDGQPAQQESARVATPGAQAVSRRMGYPIRPLPWHVSLSRLAKLAGGMIGSRFAPKPRKQHDAAGGR